MMKRLIEVALPLKEVSEQSAREKSIRHGHVSTLHIWWAWRPLAACRATPKRAVATKTSPDARLAEYAISLELAVKERADGN